MLDEFTRPLVTEATFDEIFVGQQPILMGVEPNSFCWITGDVAANREGITWGAHFDRFSKLEHAVTDAGVGLLTGLSLANERRAASEAADQPGISHSLDVFHAKREGNRARRVTEARLWKAQKQADQLWRPLKKRQQKGLSIKGQTQKAHAASRKAEALLDQAIDIETAWREVCSTLEWFTPDGRRNTSAAARAKLDEWLPKLTGSEWGKTVRLLSRPESVAFLDRVDERLRSLALNADDLEDALRVEWLRRNPGLLSGESQSSGVRRAWWMAVSVRLSQDEEFAKAVGAVREVYRRSWRASSLVEGINSVVRMQQAHHRRLTAGLVSLKRLYWNCREFRTGHRKGHTPYELLGIQLPTDDWWELINTDPDQLRKQLSGK